MSGNEFACSLGSSSAKIAWVWTQKTPWKTLANNVRRYSSRCVRAFTMNYFKLLFSQFKDILYILTNGLIFKTDCEFPRSRQLPGKRVPYFTHTKLSIHRNVWSYPRNISSPTSERSDIHEITVWVGFTLLLLNLACYICFPLWKWLKVESSGLDLTVGATWCRLMCEGCGEGFVCMCVCVWL